MIINISKPGEKKILEYNSTSSMKTLFLIEVYTPRCFLLLIFVATPKNPLLITTSTPWIFSSRYTVNGQNPTWKLSPPLSDKPHYAASNIHILFQQQEKSILFTPQRATAESLEDA